MGTGKRGKANLFLPVASTSTPEGLGCPSEIACLTVQPPALFTMKYQGAVDGVHEGPESAKVNQLRARSYAPHKKNAGHLPSAPSPSISLVIQGVGL